MARAQALLRLTKKLNAALSVLRFEAPITHVYNPLVYASAPFRKYVERYGDGPKRVVFLGMNPGPFGMAQTGVPFGEIALVRDFLGIEAAVGRPEHEHPKRPVQGFACPRSEVSGARLWGAFRERFGSADRLFRHAFVANYCPLVFMEQSGKNRTPDKLPKTEREALYSACDAHLRGLIETLSPSWVVGVGAFAEERAKSALSGLDLQIGRVLHPSPASPLANAGWADKAFEQLEALGVSTLMGAPAAARLRADERS